MINTKNSFKDSEKSEEKSMKLSTHKKVFYQKRNGKTLFNILTNFT